MDVELARTFLEVIGAGSFVAAARRLNITQSTVSTRVRLLEESLHAQLFVRNHGGVMLTPAGVRFLRPAAALVRIWEQARQDAALPRGYDAALRIGAEAGLWNRWLGGWVVWMRAHAREIALRCEAGSSEELARRLVEGTLDIAVMYSPPARPGLEIELLAEEDLVLLEADAPEGGNGEYVHVDWSEDFRREHALGFVESAPALFIGLGTLGFDYLLARGGTGYFPRGLADGQLADGRVRLVAGATSLRLRAYAVHQTEADRRAIAPALEGLRHLAAAMPVGNGGDPSGSNRPVKAATRPTRPAGYAGPAPGG